MAVRATAPSAEVALLLRCVATGGDEAVEEIGRLSSLVTDWPRVLDLASRHAVVPLVDRQLARMRAGMVPLEAIAGFHAVARQGAIRGLLLAAKLVSVVEELARCGIETLPVKGPALAALVYRDLSLRLYEDLDVLVHQRDVDRSRRVIAEQGFSSVKAFDDARDSLIPITHHEVFLHVESGVALELHWSLSHKTLASEWLEDRWWLQPHTVELGGGTLRTLGAEPLVLYLCMHGGKHSWGRIGWLCDLHRTLLRFDDIEWAAVWRMARAGGATRMVSVGLLLVNELLDGSALTSRAFELQPPDRIAHEIAARICDRINQSPDLAPDTDFVVQMHLRDRLRDRARYAIHILAEPWPADVLALQLPRSLRGAYYLFRPLRLAWKHLLHRARDLRTV